MVLEVGSGEQAIRVVEGILEETDRYWDGCEVWHDGWDGSRSDRQPCVRDDGEVGLGVRHLGTGHGRAVVCWRDEGREWLHGA